MRGRIRKEAGLIPHTAKGSDVAADDIEADTEERAPIEAREVLAKVLHRLDEEQASDVMSIDLEGKSDVADAMVVASGRSQRHIAALADKLARDLKEIGLGRVAVEGLPACDWVLIDAGDVIVHLFRPEVREFYHLERIWAPELFGADESPADGTFAPATDALEVSDTERD